MMALRTFERGSALAVIVLASTFGCTKAEPPRLQPVVLGVVLPLTGPQASYGVATRSGIELAVHEANAGQGVLGRRVRAVFIDDQSDREQAVSATQRLIAKEGAHVILGEVSSNASLAMAQNAQRARVPMISPAATAPELTRHGPFIFRACFADPFQAEVMADFAAKDRGYKKVGILRDLGSSYALALADAFEAKVKAQGVEVVAITEFVAADKDFERPLQALKDAGAEAVYLPSYIEEVGRILIAAHRRGDPFHFLGSDGWDAPELALLGEAATGHAFVTHFSAEAGPVGPFVSAFKQRFNEAPDAYAALGYDAAQVALHAIRAAKTTGPEAVQAALATTTDFEGVTGPLRFDEGGNPTKRALIVEIKGGAQSLIKAWAR